MVNVHAVHLVISCKTDKSVEKNITFIGYSFIQMEAIDVACKSICVSFPELLTVSFLYKGRNNLRKQLIED